MSLLTTLSELLLLVVIAGGVGYLIRLCQQILTKVVLLTNVSIPWMNGISQHVGDDRPPIPAPEVKG